MSDQNNQPNQPKVNTPEERKHTNNKKVLLFGIGVLIVILVVYVLCDNKKKYELTTATRKVIQGPSSQSSSSASPSSSASSASLSVSSSTDGSGSASAVRRDLANLFRAYM